MHGALGNSCHWPRGGSCRAADGMLWPLRQIMPRADTNMFVQNHLMSWFFTTKCALICLCYVFCRHAVFLSKLAKYRLTRLSSTTPASNTTSNYSLEVRKRLCTSVGFNLRLVAYSVAPSRDPWKLVLKQDRCQGSNFRTRFLRWGLSGSDSLALGLGTFRLRQGAQDTTPALLRMPCVAGAQPMAMACCY